MKTKTELESHLAKLKAELAGIESKLSEVPKLEARRWELRGSFASDGEIAKTILRIRDSDFPVLFGSDLNASRVVAVDDKWITVRRDLDDEDRVKRYSRKTGLRERTRSGYDKIDVAKVLSLWEHFQQQTLSAPRASGVPQ